MPTEIDAYDHDDTALCDGCGIERDADSIEECECGLCMCEICWERHVYKCKEHNDAH